MMNNSLRFNEYREKYKEFYYNSYEIKETEDEIYLKFGFEIPGLTKFYPETKILKKKMKFKNINTEYVENMVFNIGMIELISYWKCTCSPKVIIKCGKLDEEQVDFWKKIYFYGLGEMFYRNGIKTDIEGFMEIVCLDNSKTFIYEEIKDDLEGYIIPIGGGKDSIVTLETIGINKQRDYCLIINPKYTTLKCAEIAGIEESNIIEVYRTIDKNIIELNSKGFLNGHTPFSAMLAFMSYFIAYMTGRKYIALSNENSANESNVKGEKINHQYSKSFEFECDFEKYSNKYLKANVKYFSFLRPINELQIAKILSRKEKYHNVFKSCNIGSKNKEWNWCCNCAKCLFSYTILSPYLYKEKLINIFGEDMFENKDLLQIFIELIGEGETKPFDCVGTFEEVNFAVSKTINILESKKERLPYLLKYYKENYKLVDIEKDITKLFNEENNLNKEQEERLRKEVFFSD